MNFKLTECSAAGRTQCPIALPLWRSPVRSKRDDRGHAVCNDSVLPASETPSQLCYIRLEHHRMRHLINFSIAFGNLLNLRTFGWNGDVFKPPYEKRCNCPEVGRSQHTLIGPKRQTKPFWKQTEPDFCIQVSSNRSGCTPSYCSTRTFPFTDLFWLIRSYHTHLLALKSFLKK